MASNNSAASVEAPAEQASLATSRAHSDASSRRAAALNNRGNTTQLLQTNPFALLDYEDVMIDAEALAREHQIPEEDVATFKKGAALAKAQEHETPFEYVPQLKRVLSLEEAESLQFEREHPWKSLPKMGYFQAAVCAGCAIVQGADQTIINGAQSFYFEDFGIGKDQPLMRGFINGAPYIAAALVGCWLNTPLNKWLGRRIVLFICCTIAVVTAIAQAVSPDWQSFLASRFVLGLAVGAKSATTPVYAAECAPKNIRGALVMQWQMFTAFGIMVGYILSLAFQDAPTFGPHSQWRWMLGVTAVPPAIVMVFIFMLPESPRWYIDESRLKDSYESFCRLRCSKLLAARDCYSAYKHQEALERVASKGFGNMLREFTKRRNLRAAQNAYFVMIMQQFCGVNVLAYYSTIIFRESGFREKESLLASLGCGILNFVGALPAFFTIDRYGRRRLLLITLPILASFLYVTAGAFAIEDKEAKVGIILTTLYAFMFFYSPGMGPVPFTYSAEVFSLSARPLGMSSATSITWMFNFVISFTFPKMMNSMGNGGAFSFYATCNIAGWIYTYFFLPETKEKSLEALDQVFAGRNRQHVAQKYRDLVRRWRKHVLRQDVPPVTQGEKVELTETNGTSTPDEELKIENSGSRGSTAPNGNAVQVDRGENQGAVVA